MNLTPADLINLDDLNAIFKNSAQYIFKYVMPSANSEGLFELEIAQHRLIELSVSTLADDEKQRGILSVTGLLGEIYSNLVDEESCDKLEVLVCYLKGVHEALESKHVIQHLTTPVPSPD